MDGQIPKSTFAARPLAFIREVEKTGRALVLTNRGKPVLEIRRPAAKGDDPLAKLRGSVLFYDRPFDPVDPEDWGALRDDP